MSKLIYENKFILTKKLHSEYYKLCYRKTQKKTQVISAVLAIVTLAVAAAVMMLFRNVLITSVFATLGLYFVFMIFFGYSFRCWVDYRRMQDEHGQVIVMIVKFLSDNVNVKVNKTVFSFKYSTIEKAYETDDEIILILKTAGMIEHGQVLFKKGFKPESELIGFKQYINRRSGKMIFDIPEECAGDSVDGQ
ncbi:MAG: YcxB family protein [Lachnospiraceae bacterium]|nr:YcxB family protein [Lachnospiraceae bacterium]